MAKKSNIEMLKSMNGPCPSNIEGHPFYGLNLDNEQKEFINAILNPEKLIVFANCKAGTGKTICAVGAANLLVQHGVYDGIVYIISPTQEEKAGFLPGDVDEKTAIYTAPLYDALIKLGINPYTAIKSNSLEGQKDSTSFIECKSHLWLRGCNLENKVIIVEESQNYYLDELKKVLTRISDNSKTIVIGHSGQCDLYHYPERSGFAPYIKWYENEPYAQICKLKTNHRGIVSTKADEIVT